MANRILILGASGMLGHTLFRYLFDDPHFETFGTIRSEDKLRHFSKDQKHNITSSIEAQNDSDLENIFAKIAPDVVINCIGIIKQLNAASDHLTCLNINACLPHRLAQYCYSANARLIHFSTDCVFSGGKGMYNETDFADADDTYGRTKFLGEVKYPHTITLRTSIIGHELESVFSLIDWFLSQEGSIKGYKKAVFSGFPTIEIAHIIKEHVLVAPTLNGLYHLSADPIDKFDLLSRVASVYNKQIDIVPDEKIKINRSLNSDRFQIATGYKPPDWDALIARMYQAHQKK